MRKNNGVIIIFYFLFHCIQNDLLLTEGNYSNIDLLNAPETLNAHFCCHKLERHILD